MSRMPAASPAASTRAAAEMMSRLLVPRRPVAISSPSKTRMSFQVTALTCTGRTCCNRPGGRCGTLTVTAIGRVKARPAWAGPSPRPLREQPYPRFGKRPLAGVAFGWLGERVAREKVLRRPRSGAFAHGNKEAQVAHVTREQFLRYGVAAGASLYLPLRFDVRQALAQVPGGTLPPGSIPKYVTSLVIPPAMPRTSRIPVRGTKPISYYEIGVRQFRQNILPASMGLPTTVWSYGSVNHPSSFNYPAFTIEAKWRQPVRVKWINQLVDASGHYLPHLLPVDQTLHWANPPAGPGNTDSRGTDPTRYTGPVPIVTHLHGGPSDGVVGTLPGPAPALGDPAGLRYYEIPIVIQDRSFNADGSLFYPDSRAFFEG